MTAEVITYRGRSAVRDVGKALGLGLDVVDQMAKKLDWWDRGTLTPEKLLEVGLNPEDPTVRLVIDLSGQMLGFPRHLSQHVGGMVMTRGPLCDLVPIENASMADRTVIEWDKDDIDAVGILKVDVLALGMLTAISKCFALVEQAPMPAGAEVAAVADDRPPPPSLRSITSDDPAVYDMLSSADTVGVFQVESRAQMAMLPRLRPRCFYDLVIEVAIVRPGPIQGDMVHPYLRRRNGEEVVSFPSDALRSVLEKTLGVPLFQEQAMKVAMVAAGFTADEADKLRRAMAAWRKGGSVDAFHEKIVEGMLKNGYTLDFAERTFLQIRGFGEYGFPESHSASFARLVYVSAWLKRYHPAAFCAAILNSQPMGFYAPAQLVRDAKDHGVEVRPIDVNYSGWDCELEVAAATGDGSRPVPTEPATWGVGGPAVRLGMRLVKGLREAHAKRVERVRAVDGAFTSVRQFYRGTGLPRHAVERLAEADAFGSLGLPRREALWRVLALPIDEAPLFDWLEEAPAPAAGTPARLAQGASDDRGATELPPMPLGREVMTDYATAGLSLKRHPVALVRARLAERHVVTAAQLEQTPHGRWVRVAGLVLIRQRPGTASGIVFQTMEDETGVVNLIVRPDIYDRYRPAARHATLAMAEGYVERQGQVVHVMALKIEDLSELLEGIEFRSRDFH